MINTAPALAPEPPAQRQQALRWRGAGAAGASRNDYPPPPLPRGVTLKCITYKPFQPTPIMEVSHQTVRTSRMPWFLDPGSQVQEPGPRNLDPGSIIQYPGCWMQVPEAWIADPAFRILDYEAGQAYGITVTV